MKVHKLEVMVLDFEDVGVDDISVMIRNLKYVTACVMSSKSVDIGEWDDGHPLNKHATQEAEYKRLFGDNWLPIKTVPECGRVIVACEADTMGGWVEVLTKGQDGSWYDDSSVRVGSEVKALAWMPLPEVPEKS